MIRKFLTIILLIASLPVQSQMVDSAGNSKVVFVFEIDEGIFQPALRKFNAAMDEADSIQADIILMKLNTYGGAVDVADEIRTRLLNTKATTVVYITNNAASAGALISIACDSIYMSKEATIGAAVVVDQTGGAAGEKYQSYFRSKIRATAEAKNRDPDIAEAMVNPDVAIEGVIDSGKVLTFTASEALQNDFCDLIVNNEQDIFDHMNISNPAIIEFRPSFVDSLIRFFTNPMVSGILIMVIFFGIFFELQTPGVGFPLIAAIIAAVFYFTPLYLDGLAEHWEIVLFIVGLILIALELFVVPGFGVTGISGIIFVFSGLILSLLRNVVFDFTYTTSGDLGQSLLVVVGSISLVILLLFLLGSKFFDTSFGRLLVFSHAEKADEGFSVDNFANTDLTGQTGKAFTDLRPAGTIEIDHDRYDAYTRGEYIEKGKKVRVLKAKGISLLVEEVRHNR
jgi:membrane-bound serine protease (ClpP class)